MLKRNSRYALRGTWWRVGAILLITLGVSVLISVLRQAAISVFVPNTALGNPTMEPPPDAWTLDSVLQSLSMPMAEWIITGISSLLSLLLLTPLTLGVTRWFFKLVHGEKPSVSSIFYFFESFRDYCRAVWYDVNLGIRCALWAIPFYIAPGSILVVSILFFSGNSSTDRSVSALAGAGIFLSAVLFMLATIFYAACVCRYALTPYLLSESDEVTVRQAIRTSVAYMKGFRFSFVWFALSYVGWFLLCMFLAPVFYVWPYYSTGFAMYARFIIEKNRHGEPDSTQEFRRLEAGCTDHGG